MALTGSTMVKAYYEKICAGEQVRANLIALRDALRDDKNSRALAYLMEGDFGVFCRLLKDEDPKVRRNAAQILGKMKSEDLLPILFNTYKEEKTLYVRADHLKAIAELDYQPLLPELEHILEELRLAGTAPEEAKHVSAEIRMLQDMVMRYHRPRRHRFIGKETPLELILVTNRSQREATARQLQGRTVTMLAGGIRVKAVTVEEILGIRTWSEVLLPVETDPLPSCRPEKLGRMLAAPVLDRIQGLYQGKEPFLFRIEWKSPMTREKRGILIRRLSDGLEQASGGRLINSVSDYEVELRLLDRKDGSLIPMLKLSGIPDHRFAYRGEYVASSIAPVNAALAVELARPYLKEEAQILDPFCGVGTMLIERNYAVHAGTMYGVDIFGEAIDKARRNTEHAGMRAYYINKDFFAFGHEYLFDEIITDMPQVTASRPKQEIRELYLRFFEKAGDCLKEEAVLVLYATEPQFVLEALREHTRYRLVKRYIVNEKNGTTVFVIRWCGKRR